GKRSSAVHGVGSESVGDVTAACSGDKGTRKPDAQAREGESPTRPRANLAPRWRVGLPGHHQKPRPPGAGTPGAPRPPPPERPPPGAPGALDVSLAFFRMESWSIVSLGYSIGLE